MKNKSCNFGQCAIMKRKDKYQVWIKGKRERRTLDAQERGMMSDSLFITNFGSNEHSQDSEMWEAAAARELKSVAAAGTEGCVAERRKVIVAADPHGIRLTFVNQH